MKTAARSGTADSSNIRKTKFFSRLAPERSFRHKPPPPAGSCVWVKRQGLRATKSGVFMTVHTGRASDFSVMDAGVAMISASERFHVQAEGYAQPFRIDVAFPAAPVATGQRL